MKPALLRIRAALEPGDRESIARLTASSGFFYADEVDVALELFDLALAQGPASGYSFLVAEQAGALVGYASYGPIAGTDARWDLYWIAVDDALRGQGIGRALLAAFEQDVAQKGGRRIYVDTSSRPSYAATQHFYERTGYTLAAQLPDFYRRDDGKSIYLKVLAADPDPRPDPSPNPRSEPRTEL